MIFLLLFFHNALHEPVLAKNYDYFFVVETYPGDEVKQKELEEGSDYAYTDDDEYEYKEEIDEELFRSGGIDAEVMGKVNSSHSSRSATVAKWTSKGQVMLWGLLVEKRPWSTSIHGRQSPLNLNLSPSGF